MSFTARFDLPNFDELDVDLTNCEGCRYRHGTCDKAGKCLVEEVYE